MENSSDEQVSKPPLRFDGVTAFFVEPGVSPIRLKVWKDKLKQMGAEVESHLSKRLTHVFATDTQSLLDRIGQSRIKKLADLKVLFLRYKWIEDSLKAASCLRTEPYSLRLEKPDYNSASSWELSDSSVSDGEHKAETNPLGSTKRNSPSPDKAASNGLKRQKTDKWMDVIQREATFSVVGHKSTGNYTDGKEDISYPNVEATYNPPNLNKNITEPFEELKNIYKDALGDDRRSFSYYKALSVLEKFPSKITSVDQVKGLPTIGKSLQNQIQEILEAGKLSRLEHLKNDPKVQVLALFSSVWGIGPSIAQKFYDKGHRTLQDLLHDNTLTESQRLGILYHDDTKKKIPRDEVTEMETLIQKVAAEISPDINVICGGSYRRGKAFSGDMDMVVTHPDGRSHKGFLRKLVERLKEVDFLTEDLVVSVDHSVKESGHGVDTYYGLCKYPGRQQRHRIDYKVYPLDQYPFGLIAWTGNDVLNRRLRLLAESKGYKLDDHGLYPFTRDAAGHKEANRDAGVPCKTEREVFEFLGLPYLQPHERNL